MSVRAKERINLFIYARTLHIFHESHADDADDGKRMNGKTKILERYFVVVLGTVASVGRAFLSFIHFLLLCVTENYLCSSYTWFLFIATYSYI